ncbi:MAG: pantetheine-phosphate adenylyltransferase, partial [Proteobacteria bacterium]|nr:pantetheine-phosphate adenylyltransferase [Pseudomonadota bacterium]
MTKIAIYPGTFDPITSGHVDIIDQALKVFDQVIVIVACNTRKATWLSVEQRVALVKAALAEKSEIKVVEYDGVIVEFAREHKATAIVRGLRTSADYENEFQLAGMNRTMEPDILTVFFP